MNERVLLVAEILRDFGHPHKIVALPDDAHTAQAAADAIHCQVSQIAKSIIFKLEPSKTALLVVASGVNRIDEKKVETVIGERLTKANAKFVRDQTGFVIGGVSPIGHINSIQILIDEDLFQYDKIWAAAGHPKTVFEMTPDELLLMTKGKVVSVKVE
jgi:prolyl-tRNA editing enzyme YbaK/EbsC (Cys-tRNA(Pro) deacylase)